MEVNANNLFKRKTCTSGPCGQMFLPCRGQTQALHTMTPSQGWTHALEGGKGSEHPGVTLSPAQSCWPTPVPLQALREG